MVRTWLLVAVVLVGVSAAVAAASAAEWPAERQFVLVEPQPTLYLSSPPSAIAEDGDGSLLLLLYWPVTGSTDTRVLRIAPDGSRAFVHPFDALGPGESGSRFDVGDEILPLPDGSILLARFFAIDRLRPDGSIVRFAGIGRYGEEPSGEGGLATAAGIGLVHGLSRFRDGSIVFADRSRIRRVSPDGVITTIAGSGPSGLTGDGGPATATQLASPLDVLESEGGGFLIADIGTSRVREVSAQGVVSTVAGTNKSDIFQSFGDGGPATAAGLALPAHLGRLPDGSLLIGEHQRIRRVSVDGTISTIFDAQPVHRGRLGDFAGRYGEDIQAMEVTREGGVAVMLSGVRLRAVYLAPRHTRRTLLGLRSARVSRRSVTVTVDTTSAGRLRLQIRRRGRVVANASRRVASGRRVIRVGGRFAAAVHDVRVTLRANRGGGGRDGVRLFTSQTLPERLVVPALASYDPSCRRIDSRRIDCETHDVEDEADSGRSCLNTSAYRLFASGVLFTRPYGPRCHRRPIPFDRTPRWGGPWRALTTATPTSPQG